MTRTPGPAVSYDRNAPRRAVHLSLNEDLVARAKAVTPNLSSTVEALLAGYLQDADAKRNAQDEALDQALSALDARHEEQGFLSDEFGRF